MALSRSPGFREAALPLFSEGLVDAIEWEIDEAWGFDDRLRELPAWIVDILDTFAEDDALYGHGVWFSLLSARLEPRQERWLRWLADECARRPYRHVTEHFAWSSAGRFARNTTLPLPRSDVAVKVGVDRLTRIAEAAGVPVGLEPHAASLAAEDALTQGGCLAEVLTATGGFLILDVHNIWTEAVNLDLDPMTLFETFPLHLVRELHVSGGSWWQSSTRPVRLDSHDGEVVDPVFELAAAAFARCPNLEVAFLERRDGTLQSPEHQARYRDDYRRLRALAEAA